MRFEFATAQQIIFGPDTAAEAGVRGRELGRRALVVTGRNPRRARPALEAIEAAGISATLFPVGEEPTTDLVTAGTARARDEKCEFVIGLGGGSAIDAAKAIAALATNPRDLLDYLEVIGNGLPFEHPSLPCIAIPTTAGTGAEVTRNAVLASPKHGVKVSMRSLSMLPRMAIVDPTLTRDLPPEITAATGLDALTQLIEPYVSARANPLSDGLCVEGIRRVAGSLRKAFTDGNDPEARENMSLASLFGGMALANAGLGAVHGFAGAIGGMFAAPHGAVCAALLPAAMAGNIRALRARAPQSEALRRYDQLGPLLTGKPDASAEDAVTWVRELCHDLQIAPLRKFGLTAGNVPQIVEKAALASSMKTNAVKLTPDELAELLTDSL